MENNGKEVLLSVKHLCQYFKFGRRTLKAVDDVSFDVYKGEVFGLVGESGCGKTTTGRSIIKLYDITSGDVYFKGVRIAAGTKSYKDAIAQARAKAKASTKALNAEIDDKIKDAYNKLFTEVAAIEKEIEALDKKDEKVKELQAKLATAKANAKADENLTKQFEEQKEAFESERSERQAAIDYERDTIVNKNKEEIKKAIHDHKESDKDYSMKLQAEIKEKYNPLLEKASEEEKPALVKEMKKELSIARKTRLVTQIQMIFQDPIASLNPRMTVQEIIEEGLVIQGVKDKEYLRKKVVEILETVGLVGEHASRYPHEFSGGQRQRIGIARSVIMNPEMIIADEPISALDVSIQAQVINLLNDLRNKLGLTVLFIAHNLSVVKYFSDRIGVMYFGKMVELADAEELFAHPLHPYTKSLLSAIPLPDPVYEKQRVRVTYNPVAEHDYNEDKPSFREISPRHYVYCNDQEEAKYKKELGIEK